MNEDRITRATAVAERLRTMAGQDLVLHLNASALVRLANVLDGVLEDRSGADSDLSLAAVELAEVLAEDTDDDDHDDNDDCMKADGSHVVLCDGVDTLVSELEVGDAFYDDGHEWIVKRTAKVNPDEYHIDYELADKPL